METTKEEARKKEAKWLSDLETLKTHYNKFQRDNEGYLIKDTKENAEKYMRVSIENSDKFVDMENEKIRKEKNAVIESEVLELLEGNEVDLKYLDIGEINGEGYLGFNLNNKEAILTGKAKIYRNKTHDRCWWFTTISYSISP